LFLAWSASAALGGLSGAVLRVRGVVWYNMPAASSVRPSAGFLLCSDYLYYPVRLRPFWGRFWGFYGQTKTPEGLRLSGAVWFIS